MDELQRGSLMTNKEITQNDLSVKFRLLLDRAFYSFLVLLETASKCCLISFLRSIGGACYLLLIFVYYFLTQRRSYSAQDNAVYSGTFIFPRRTEERSWTSPYRCVMLQYE